MTTLSVIISAYQRGRLVKRCLEAYSPPLNQDAEAAGGSYECILVEDHSPSGALDQLQHLFKSLKSLRCGQMPMNAGPGPTRDAWGEDAQVTSFVTRLQSGWSNRDMKQIGLGLELSNWRMRKQTQLGEMDGHGFPV